MAEKYTLKKESDGWYIYCNGDEEIDGPFTTQEEAQDELDTYQEGADTEEDLED